MTGRGSRGSKRIDCGGNGSAPSRNCFGPSTMPRRRALWCPLLLRLRGRMLMCRYDSHGAMSDGVDARLLARSVLIGVSRADSVSTVEKVAKPPADYSDLIPIIPYCGSRESPPHRPDPYGPIVAARGGLAPVRGKGNAAYLIGVPLQAGDL